MILDFFWDVLFGFQNSQNLEGIKFSLLFCVGVGKEIKTAV